MSKVYDENGIFIPHSVSKENPCWVCGAMANNAHANYCPNSRYLKELQNTEEGKNGI